LVQKLSSGQITPGEAQPLFDCVTERRRLIEAEEFHQLITALEQKQRAQDQKTAA